MSTTDADPRPPLFDEARCTCAALRRTTRLITAVYDDALRPLGIKLTQYSLLRNIRDQKGPSITRLAELMMMDRTTLTRNLAPLRKAGWVQVGDADGRTRSVRLTPKGQAMLSRAVPLWREAEERVRALIGPETARALRTDLDAVSRTLRAFELGEVEVPPVKD